MVKTVQDYYYNDKTGLPMRTSMFVLGLNFALRLLYKMIKAVSSAAQRICPSGIDGKKIIEE